MKNLIIDKNSLKQAIEIVFERIANIMDTPLLIPHDYYLNISMKEAYNVENDTQPAIGSLHDDWENLSKVINKQQAVTFVDVDRLAAILRAISQEVNPL